MKKINLLSIGLMSMMALVGCNGSSPLENAIENLRKGFIIDGEIYQKAKFLDSYDGAYTGEEAEHNFVYTYIMENGETVGMEREFLGIDEDGSTYTVLDDLFIRGEDGHVYYNELTYTNEVVETPAVETSGKIVTGDIIAGKDMSGKNKSKQTIVIYGDVNGDGDITIKDLLIMRKYLLGTANLDSIYQQAGNVNKDNNGITIKDILILRKQLLGSASIEQK